MKSRGVAAALAWLVAVYLVVLAAEWVAPYNYRDQMRELPLAPPTRIHFVDPGGQWHLRPFVYRLAPDPANPGRYVEDRRRRFPIRLFVAVPEDSQVAAIGVRTRLFGVDPEARILLLGSDRFGRDLLSRLLYGGRVSLGAGLLAGLITVGLGIALGGLAGYFGGALDTAVMRTGELLLSLPWLYLLIAVRAFLPLNVTTVQAFLLTIVLISLIGWVAPARMARGVVLTARERDFVKAARGFGASELYLLRRHVLPQTRGVALTQLAVNVPRFIVAEVTLSFLGLGISEPVPSWGNMLADLQHYHVLTSTYWMACPAIALIAVVLSYHRLASALQERLDAVAG